MTFVDTHTHLDFANDPVVWIERAKEAGVNKIICVGTSVEASRKSVEIAEKYSTSKDSGQARMTEKKEMQIYATVGIHAQDGKGDVEKFGGLDKCIDELRKILDQAENDKLIVGIGECGFDIHLVASDQRPVTNDEERGFQKELFEVQIKLAAELRLPLVVHCRNAWEETFQLLTAYSRQLTANGVFHSWTGDWEAAKRAIDLGFYISFSGIVTFKNAVDIQDVARRMPLDKMLLETDSPFLTPEPIRSGRPPKLTSRLSSTIRTRLEERNRRVFRQNEPKNVKIIAQFIARLRNLPVSQVASVTSVNAGRLFSF
ncbi:MAG: TatD family hydrolase [Candidatus Curtissbacteria bacterium]|nr:TatD family hydrolase [Candidatus Curtissbacteria bacterium]